MKTLNRQEIYNGKIIRVIKDDVELANGIRTTREVVYHKEAVAVVAVDENNKILLVTQYRYAIGKDLQELPAGLVDEGEEPLDAAKRELLEETGCRAARWELLTSAYTSPGSHNEKIYVFSASDLSRVADQRLDKDEILTFSQVPFSQALSAVKEGKIADAKTIIGILLYHAVKQQEECC
jgi:ADP-ribose pyrophosphatase